MLDNELYVNDVHLGRPEVLSSSFESASSSMSMPSIPKGGILVRVSNL